MNEILTKISSYNIFNYLFPGAVYCVLGDRAGVITLRSPDIATTLLIYYFVGLAISRIGSVCIEPVLKKFRFVTYSNYSDYVTACTKDAKVEVFVEVSNTYRTLAAVFLLLPLSACVRKWADVWHITETSRILCLSAALLIIFLISFRKQSAYISKRVSHHSGNAIA
jgi:hypothetical protein